MHGHEYVNKDAIFLHPRATRLLCQEMAMRFRLAGADTVVGPAVGGALLAQWVAHSLTEMTGKEILAVFADKGENSTMIIKRGYGLHVHNKKILVVEDILNTGGSARATIKAVEDLGGAVVGLAALLQPRFDHHRFQGCSRGQHPT